MHAAKSNIEPTFLPSVLPVVEETNRPHDTATKIAIRTTTRILMFISNKQICNVTYEHQDSGVNAYLVKKIEFLLVTNI